MDSNGRMEGQDPGEGERERLLEENLASQAAGTRDGSNVWRLGREARYGRVRMNFRLSLRPTSLGTARRGKAFLPAAPRESAAPRGEGVASGAGGGCG
jgi:hypothetical protein